MRGAGLGRRRLLPRRSALRLHRGLHRRDRAGRLDWDGGDCPVLAGSCCDNNGTPGCEQVECEATVCELDAYCCDTAWDGLCAGCAGGAPGFNGIDCTSTYDTCGACWDCAPGEVLGCDATTCFDGSLVGDGVCELGLQCPEQGFDGGDCEALCGEGEIASCDGLDCLPAALLGDGICQVELACEATGDDGGDCCSEGTVEDCSGACVDAVALGDGVCDDNLACAATLYDAGDCPFECPPGDVVDCSGVDCVFETWIGDGICDGQLNCEQFGNDGGDCQ